MVKEKEDMEEEQEEEVMLDREEEEEQEEEVILEEEEQEEEVMLKGEEEVDQMIGGVNKREEMIGEVEGKQQAKQAIMELLTADNPILPTHSLSLVLKLTKGREISQVHFAHTSVASCVTRPSLLTTANFSLYVADTLKMQEKCHAHQHLTGKKDLTISE